jgi:HEAT repeat protein
MAGLLDAPKDADMAVRSQIILTLAEIGPGAKKGVPQLVELAAAKSVDVRGSAVYALGEIGWADKTVVFALSKALKDDDAGVCKAAALALGKLESDERQ